MTKTSKTKKSQTKKNNEIREDYPVFLSKEEEEYLKKTFPQIKKNKKRSK